MKTATKPPATDAGIGRLPAVRQEVLVPFGQSLYLKRRPNGRQSWVLRTRMGGSWQVRQLGDWPTVGMHMARQRAEAARTDLAVPRADSTVKATLDAFCREYIAARYRTEDAQKQSASLLERALAGLAGRSLSSVRRIDITHAVQRMSDTPNSASKTLALLKQFTGWGVARGLLEVDPLGGVTASRLGLLPYSPRERVLTHDELRTLWQRTDADAHVLRFCMLTACRIGEALQIEPAQVAGKAWTIPMTKNGKPHVVPLSAAAAELLPLPRPVYVSMVCRMKVAGLTWRPHDLRRTAATLMREAGVPVFDVETVLNHAPPQLVRVYQRHDGTAEKTAALNTLAERVAAIVAAAA